ncbi:hypothetical protein [Epibacterium sp. Ofav1-8]|uniref:hypothetical protein n=1 Tax=Epibacterium sp. Ofav1-8 TaxID=2917735 RepID=UPI001EF643EB|nr:hypothetical protein [Epibacterium sp. Ofav1-8]MCG7623019.1 hypothetical protein [Epibacterium sp. Ofav1-8]
MAKQDDWIRITLRLPRDLHARINAAGGASSLNATIVTALDEQFPASAEDKLKSLLEEYDRLLASDDSHKAELRQLYDWGIEVLERGLKAEKNGRE